jgi:hypothetical protein
MADRYAASGPSLLFVTSDPAGAAEGEAVLRAAVPGLAVTRCGSLDAAQAYLAAAAFDVVCVDAELPGDAALDALALRARLGARAPVFVLGQDGVGPDALRRALGLPDEGPGGDGAAAEADARALLDEVRLALGRAVHAANNPLTVVAGNAQFLLEVATSMELDPTLVRSLEDIEMAGRQLQEALADLAAARQRLASVLTGTDGLA